MSRKDVPGYVGHVISLKNAIYTGDTVNERKIQVRRGEFIPEGVRERAQHVFSLSRSFRTAECSRSNAGMTLVLYRIVECPNGREREREGRRFDLFHSSIILFYFPRRSIFVATFWSIALDTSGRRFHFYLRSDATGRWDSSPFPLTSPLFSSTSSALFPFWFVQLFAILFPFVEIIADAARPRSSTIGVCRAASILDKVLPGKAVWRV